MNEYLCYFSQQGIVISNQSTCFKQSDLLKAIKPTDHERRKFVQPACVERGKTPKSKSELDFLWHLIGLESGARSLYQWTFLVPLFQVGMILTGIIVRVMHFGALVEFSVGLSGLALNSVSTTIVYLVEL